MKGGSARRVRVYIGESDHYHGHSMQQAILNMLRREGYPGATVVRAVAGFGKASRLHTASILRLSEDLPVVIEVVASEEQVNRLLPMLSDMGVQGLITVEDVEVYQYGASKSEQAGM